MSDKGMEEKMSPILWVPDKGRSTCHVADSRAALIECFALDRVVLKELCARVFCYERYVVDILSTKSEEELFANFPKSWQRMRACLKDKEERRWGRNCWATAKDILMDGLWTDLIALYMHDLYEDFYFKNNNVNDLWGHATLLPDFELNDGRAFLEMKTGVDDVDYDGRSSWSGRTHTIRRDKIESEYSRYEPYDTPQHPLYYLRINTDIKKFAIVRRSWYEPSYSHDGTLYANITPVSFGGTFVEFISKLHDEIVRVCNISR